MTKQTIAHFVIKIQREVDALQSMILNEDYFGDRDVQLAFLKQANKFRMIADKMEEDLEIETDCVQL
jgi:hypothetical protein